MATRSFTAAKTGTAGDATFDSLTFNAADYFYTPPLGLSIEGTARNDALWGTNLDDLIRGLAGNDRLYGEDGNDTLDGGIGDDFMLGGRGADALIGGDGIDTASYYNAAFGVSVQLGYRGFGSDAEGDTYSGVENVVGSSWDDSLFGDAGNNRLEGGRGNDFIVGGAGRDTIIGGLGKDTLYGDAAGIFNSDVFVVSRVTETWDASDRIMDFQIDRDKVMLSGFTAAALGNDGKLAKGFVENGVFVSTEFLDASDTIYFDDLEGVLYEVQIAMNGNTAELVSRKAIVEMEVDMGNSWIGTSDFLFG
jgi:Ca2+-binding RTX toxin-like protein